MPGRAFVQGLKEIEARYGRQVMMEAQKKIRSQARIKDISWYYKYRKGLVDYSVSKRIVIESVLKSYGVKKEMMFGL